MRLYRFGPGAGTWGERWQDRHEEGCLYRHDSVNGKFVPACSACSDYEFSDGSWGSHAGLHRDLVQVTAE